MKRKEEMTNDIIFNNRRKKISIFFNFLSSLFLIFPYRVRAFLFLINRNTPGLFGVGIRYLLIKKLTRSCGNNVYIAQNVYFNNMKNLSIGNNVSIHPMCYIDASGEISIGNNVSIAHCSTILSTNHTYSNNKIPIKYNDLSYKKTTIHDDVWIGCGARILSGVIIYQRSIVAAGAVVTKEVKSNSIYAGVPAKFLKSISYDS